MDRMDHKTTGLAAAARRAPEVQKPVIEGACRYKIQMLGFVAVSSWPTAPVGPVGDAPVGLVPLHDLDDRRFPAVQPGAGGGIRRNDSVMTSRGRRPSGFRRLGSEYGEPAVHAGREQQRGIPGMPPEPPVASACAGLRKFESGRISITLQLHVPGSPSRGANMSTSGAFSFSQWEI